MNPLHDALAAMYGAEARQALADVLDAPGDAAAREALDVAAWLVGDWLPLLPPGGAALTDGERAALAAALEWGERPGTEVFHGAVQHG